MGQGLQTGDRDDQLAALASEGCRNTLAAIRSTPESTTSIHRLAGESCPGNSVGRVATAVRLHHVILPKLDDAGLVDYDPGEHTVRYPATERTEAWLAAVQEEG